MLRCNIKTVENGYPLIIEAEKVEVIPSDFDADLTRSMLKKIQWIALRSAAANLSLTEIDGIEEMTEEMAASDEDLLRRIHRLLFEIHIQEGALICPESHRRFPIKDGIPNLLLNEDEC